MEVVSNCTRTYPSVIPEMVYFLVPFDGSVDSANRARADLKKIVYYIVLHAWAIFWNIFLFIVSEPYVFPSD